MIANTIAEWACYPVLLNIVAIAIAQWEPTLIISVSNGTFIGGDLMVLVTDIILKFSVMVHIHAVFSNYSIRCHIRMLKRQV